ncbi:MAG: TetR/AcrR family transcriptional regulator [Roseiflexaceae bacterium]
MKKGEIRRQQLLERLADHLLANGLQGASLRPLAAAVGTSDRMLLHYFTDKEQLLSEVLALVSQRLLYLLQQTNLAPLPLQQLLPLLSGMLRDPLVSPYMRLWLELVALAAHAQEPFRSVAQQICITFRDWIATLLSVEDEQQRSAAAALTLALIEGLAMFDALDAEAAYQDTIAGVQAYLR